MKNGFKKKPMKPIPYSAPNPRILANEFLALWMAKSK